MTSFAVYRSNDIARGQSGGAAKMGSGNGIKGHKDTTFGGGKIAVRPGHR